MQKVCHSPEGEGEGIGPTNCYFAMTNKPFNNLSGREEGDEISTPRSDFFHGPLFTLSLILPPLGFLDVDDTGGVNVTHTL